LGDSKRGASFETGKFQITRLENKFVFKLRVFRLLFSQSFGSYRSSSLNQNIPKISDRQKFLYEIDELLDFLILRESSLSQFSDGEEQVQKDIDEILELKFVVENTRYFKLEKTPIPKSVSYPRDLLWRLPEAELRQAIRMDYRALCRVEELIRDDMVFRSKSTNPQREVWLQLALALERFGCDGNGISVGRLSRLFGVGNGTVILYTRRVISALLNIRNRFIVWPNSIRRQEINKIIGGRSGFSGCVGFVDGTDLVFAQKPAIDGEVFFTRKHRYALNAQLICDDEKRIIYFSCG